MPRNRSCGYCGSDIEPGTGTMFVRVNGTTSYFCSSKCEKNASLGRESRDLEWTGGDEDVQEPVEDVPESDETETVVGADQDEETTPDLEAAEEVGSDLAESETADDVADKTADEEDDAVEQEEGETALTDEAQTAETGEDERETEDEETEAEV